MLFNGTDTGAAAKWLGPRHLASTGPTACRTIYGGALAKN
jgi:hypothetical protein